MKLLHIYIIRCTLLVAMLFAVSWTRTWAAEAMAYVVLSSDYASLTFYFDENQNSHSEGTVILVDEMLQTQQLMMNRGSITMVTIDASFANYGPTSTASWFNSMSQLRTLDLSNLTMTNVTNTDEMFSGCSSLTTITVNDTWPAQNGAEGTVTPGGSGSSVSGSNMFNGCTSLVGGAGTPYDASHVDYTYAHIDGGDSNPGYFTEASASGRLEIFAVEEGQAITPNQPITATQSIVLTPGNDTEWPTNMSMGSAWVNPLEFTASIYYPNSTTTYTFVNSLRGTNNPKDGELQSDGTNVGNGYKYNQKNLPVSGGFLVFEAKQNGSLIVPIRVFANKPLYVTDGNGKAKTDIQFKDADGQTYTLLTTTLCAVSDTEDVTGFVSFNVTQGEKYYVFCTGSKARFGGYVFSTETIDIDPATMKDVKSILETEPYAVLSENNTVLTFYYDDKKEQMNGMDVGPFSINSRTERGWNDVSITTVVFDASMANDTTLTSTACWFSDCTYLTSIRGMEYLKTSKVKDMSFMFGGCSSLTSISGLQYLNTSNVTKMVEMFFGCYSLTSLELGNFNTENVTDMNGMFSACKGLTSLDLRSFNTANVTIMANMFSSCSGLTSLDLSGFKTDNMESMVGMFNGCSVLKTITVGSGWVVNNTGAGGTTRDIGENMFHGCTSLKGGKGTVYDDTHTGSEYARIDNAPDAPGYFTDINAPAANPEPYAVLSDNNTVLTFYYDDQKTAKGGMDVGPFVYDSKDKRGWSPYTSQITKAVLDQSFDQCTTLTSTAYWFTYMTQLETIEHIEYLHTDNVESMAAMFDSCYVLRDLDVSHFVTAKVKNMECMFNRCEALTSLNLSNFNTSSCTFMRGMFYDCKGLTRLDLTNFNTLKNTSTECMFELCSSLESITFGYGFSTENVTSMGWMFDGCSALKNIDVGRFNTNNVTNMQAMFHGCGNLSELNVSSFNTEKVMDMSGMFLACTSLTSLDVSGFNTQQVTNMQDMFRACTNLTSLDLSRFNTQNVTEMYGMFYNCTNLKSLDLSNFDTRNVRNMDHLFRFCTNLVNLNISGFSTANGASQRNMFEGCSSLASIQAGNAVIADSTYAQIGNPNLLLYVNEASQAPQSVRNVVVLDEAEQIVLTDTVGNNNFYCPKQFRAKSISYTHNFRQTTLVGVSRGWETIALPFTVQTITHEKNGTLTPFGVEGGKPFWLRELTGNGLVSARHMDAYVPYLISMPNNSIYPDDYNQAGQVTFSATNAVVPVTESRETSGNNRTLIPTMMSVAQSPDIYVINRDTTYQNNPQGSIFVADYREVRPFEAYVKHVGGARYFSLSEIPLLDVTGIETIELKQWNGEQWWTLDGRKLNGRPSKKGIYIRNGKKVVVDATF